MPPMAIRLKRKEVVFRTTYKGLLLGINPPKIIERFAKRMKPIPNRVKWCSTKIFASLGV